MKKNNIAATLENSLAVFFFTKLNMQLPYNPAIALLGIYPGEMKTYKILNLNVYSSCIRNSRNRETIQMSSDSSMIKQ